MERPEHFRVAGDLAVYAPEGRVPLHQGIQRVIDAIRFAVEQKTPT